MVILELIHAPIPDSVDGLCLLVTEPTQAPPGLVVIHNNRTNRMASAGDEFMSVPDLSASDGRVLVYFGSSLAYVVVDCG